ncbi:tRNA (adenosine(37)-N6)-threonylcarbamoyltransferase complex ATPase subunit type 1 TsaE [Mycoplasmopsis bovirhinis]|uniref:tRNA threonylcarbamoyladenosine biosynthesis protein TsaE n=1 Tax=Mycoplasmopsis bovirhinis TaxID=29553 RepID=A0A449AEJ1_9BACT|nr:tRNA (adenosine(37)-N6)-threonylcarbamoyltransferase complex ATPase subunit type 1 TsaE [Mycoplasmopsis bovirhinis]VEU63420.1 ATPase or kinase [Mycoplasmopsis bovirhinis]
MKIYNLNNESQLAEVVSFWLPIIKKKKIVLLNGDLGSGKTTFIKELAKQLGIKEKITSPSFNYMKVYNGLIHIDLYNYKGDINEFEDYFEDNVVAIEWANLFNLDYKNYVEVNASLNNDESHTFEIKEF